MTDYFIGGDLSDSLNSIANTLGFENDSIEEQNDIGASGYELSPEYHYPSNIGDGSHNNILVIRVVDLIGRVTSTYYGDMRNNFTSNRNQSNVSANQNEELLSTLVLPMPVLQDRVVHDVGAARDDPTAILASAGIALADSAVGGGVEALTKAARGITVAANDALNATSANVRNSAGQGSRQSSAAKNGTVINNNPQTDMWVGTQLREQTMTWEFNPKSLPELKNVAGIIKTLYKYSHGSNKQHNSTAATVGDDDRDPYKQAGFFIKLPPVIQIEEITVTDAPRFTPRFIMGPAAISSLSINYTPDEYWKTFKGTAGDPASIVLEITFKELIPMTQEIINNDYNSSIKGSTYY